MKIEKYSMSFTTGALFHQESLKIAELFSKLRNWDKVRNEVINNNLLQLRTLNSSKRTYSEICSRLKKLTEDELTLLLGGTHQEQAYLLWLAVCRRYHFIRDFAIEVIRERILSFCYDLNDGDFDVFFNMKSEWHEEMQKITFATKNKLRQILFKMLSEAKILCNRNTVNLTLLTPNLINTIGQTSYQDLLVFPVMESEIKRMIK